MRQEYVRVAGCGQVAPGLHLLRLQAPWLAQAARPGQFVHVRCGGSYDPLLRRPLSVHRVARRSAREGDEVARPQGERLGAAPALAADIHESDRATVGRLLAGEVALLFRVAGRGTAWLAARKPGDEVDVLGPLGRPFAISPSSRRLLLVAGGVGVAPLVMLAEEALAGGLAVALAAGARKAADIYPSHLLPPEVEYRVATEDGSAGQRGLVTELLPDLLDWADEVCACGPLPMLAALKRLPRRLGSARVQASLEGHMGCALGVCYGCVVETRRGPQRVCQDGPVFDLDQLELA